MISLRSLLACSALVAVGLPAAAEAQRAMSADAASGVAKRSNCVIGVQPGGVGIFEHFGGAWRIQNPASVERPVFVLNAAGFQSVLEKGHYNVSRACNTVTVSGCGESYQTGPWLPGNSVTMGFGDSGSATLTCGADGGYTISGVGGNCVNEVTEEVVDNSDPANPVTTTNVLVEEVTFEDAGGPGAPQAAPRDNYIPAMGGYPAWSCGPGEDPGLPPPSPPGTFTPTPGGVTIGGGKAFRCRNAIGEPTGTVTNLAGEAGNFLMDLESPFGRVAAITAVYNTETLQLIAYGPTDPSHPARMCFNPDLAQDDFVSCDDAFNRFNAPRVSGQRQSGWWAAYFTGGSGQTSCTTEDPETLEPNTVTIEGVTYSGVTYNCGSPILCAIEDE